LGKWVLSFKTGYCHHNSTCNANITKRKFLWCSPIATRGRWPMPFEPVFRGTDVSQPHYPLGNPENPPKELDPARNCKNPKKGRSASFEDLTTETPSMVGGTGRSTRISTNLSQVSGKIGVAGPIGTETATSRRSASPRDPAGDASGAAKGRVKSCQGGRT